MPTDTSLSIIIPAYNEASRLPKTLEFIAAYLNQRDFFFSEVIVVDDGSWDNTLAVAAAASGKFSNFRVIRNARNRGKGDAVRQGMLQARGEWALFTDADLSTPIHELDAFLSIARSSDAAVLIGSRALTKSVIEKRQSWFRVAAGRTFNLLVQLMTGLSIRDSQCGFKLYRKDAAHSIFGNQRLNGFSFDVEDLVIAERLDFRIIELPVCWRNEAGTKVTALAGIKSYIDLVKISWYRLAGAYSHLASRPANVAVP